VETRKVQGAVPVDVHRRAHQLAREGGTTVGVLVAEGLRRLVRDLKTDKTAAARLPKDQRLKGKTG
jgi:hypothetical protein